MDVLKERVSKNMNKLNQEWVTAINEAKEAKKEVDVTLIIGKISEIGMQMDQAFLDYEERHKKDAKGGMFKW